MEILQSCPQPSNSAYIACNPSLRGICSSTIVYCTEFFFFFSENKIYWHFYHFSTTRMRWLMYVVEILPPGRQGPFYPALVNAVVADGIGDTRSQGISSYGFDSVVLILLSWPEYSGFNTRMSDLESDFQGLSANKFCFTDFSGKKSHSEFQQISRHFLYFHFLPLTRNMTDDLVI